MHDLLHQFFGSTQTAIAFLLGFMIVMSVLSTEEDVITVRNGLEVLNKNKSS